MQKVILFLAFLVSLTGYCQFNDDFSDGDFTENPAWIGDLSHFEVNSSGQLHLHSTGSDTSYLFTRSETATNTEWDFWIKLSFNTSANNYARIYLCLDTLDLLSANSYYLQAGGADDSLCIFRQEGEVHTRLYAFRSYRMTHSTNILRIRIIRELQGTWQVFTDTTGGHALFPDGTFNDNGSSVARWFGLSCRYTSSNSTKYYFDDFYIGPILRDTLSPAISNAEIVDGNRIRLSFTEGIPPGLAEEKNHYRLIASNRSPDSARMDPGSQGMVSLYFSGGFPNEQWDTLLVTGIEDQAGNRMPDTLLPVVYYRAKPFDLLIHEIMADPDPVQGLPDGEFVELYNRSPFPVNLNRWSFSYGGTVKHLPPVVVQPDHYLLLAKDPAYLSYGPGILLFSSSSSLANDGSELVLRDQGQQVIHAVEYDINWYRGSFKDEGGWSLEMIDPSNPCGCYDNWNASCHPMGGTPGKPNSVKNSNPDATPPLLTRALISDTAGLLLFFSEAIDTMNLRSDCWSVWPDDISPDSIVFSSAGHQMASLYFSEPFQQGIIYRLQSGCLLKDCAGNPIDTSRAVRFAKPDTASLYDVVINEILADPFPGGSRFIELYNRSEKVIDLGSLTISALDTSGGVLQGAVPASEEGFLLFPGDHLALCASPEKISEQYRVISPDRLVETLHFPSLETDSGLVVLARAADATVIDKVNFDEGMHYPLLVSCEGVSLERLHPDRPSSDRTNWHSASETAGFATPGYLNSHGNDQGEGEGILTVEPAFFSPDNDGKDDLVTIRFEGVAPDVAVTLSVYDAMGRLVNILANNVLISSQELFSWDGTTAGHLRAATGSYVIFAELISGGGSVTREKTVVFLGGRF